MTGQTIAPLTVKFQFRMTEDERRMLQEMTEKMWPESADRAQSLFLRRLIWHEYWHMKMDEEQAKQEQKP